MARGYYTITQITDFGPYITKLVLPMPSADAAKAVTASTFSVFVERTDDKGETLMLPKSWMARDVKEPSRGYVPVKTAYPSDINGSACEGGEFVTLEVAYGPMMQLSATICAPAGMNVYIKSLYTVTQTQPIDGANGLVYDFCLGNSTPQAYGWLNDRSTGKEPLGYGYFVPQKVEAGKRPLIIWLHGAGEGGSDPTVAYTANKAVAFSSEKVQSYFGGAYVLVPQTPTFWMDDGAGQYATDGSTQYGKALKACIDEFVAKNENIDRDRIYIGGDSNGGFMTMRMVLDYPDFFAAAFPCCEALYERTITDENIASIKHLPIWFTHAKNDPIVKPDETVVPTYKRIVESGNKNVHFTFWDKIEDIHEGFKTPDGKPFEYIGHFAWIPLYNDDCKLDFDGKPVVSNGREVTLLQWLALQKRG